MGSIEAKSGQEKIYQMVTDRIVAILESGVIPWRKPWGDTAPPSNFISKKEYRGINVFMLSAAMYQSRYWMSFKQVTEAGGKVKKGEKGYPVLFWKWLEISGEDEIKRIPLLRYYTVFNLYQCEGINIEDVSRNENNIKPIDAGQKIVDGMPNKPYLEHGRTKAAYSPSKDVIFIPDMASFIDAEEYYATLFHEMVHSTGHAARLNRYKEEPNDHMFGSDAYSKEELIAEMGAAFLCAEAGISQKVIENQAAYISGWLGKLRRDNRILIQAASKSQKAADYILNRIYDK
jgi:antirestriction protein ArdC